MWARGQDFMVSVLLSSYNVEFEHTTWSLFTQCLYGVAPSSDLYILMHKEIYPDGEPALRRRPR